MGPKVAWILRPPGAIFVGALACACLVSPTRAAAAASGVPMLQPDAPPSGAVVGPTPDPPAAKARASTPAVGRAPTVVRPTLRTTKTTTATAAPRAAAHATETKHATTAPPHAASSQKRKPAVAPVVLRRARLPDTVAAFLAMPVVKPAEAGIDRAAIALAGMLLAVVALGGGCLTVAVARVAQER
jgi:hypothetical protein